ncbi:hypothetical protein HPP92_001758 [Vanilla planifolia]|uniref:DET1- and DDB1-associated protein 1 domain-containing protein n=1 Tax=Vanilla planifolia TaxID=51239 RepID=A0A835S3Z3_VANPL|nr:hypothetical protein HPP92_001758 [Vanilla planifolia]
MGSLLGDLPSFDPHNFSELRPSDSTAQPSKLVAATYRPTHNRTVPPPNQVIITEARNILLRQIYKKAEEKLRSKRAATEHLTPEHGSKQPRGASAEEQS